MADDKDKGPADEPDLSAGDPERQSEEAKQEVSESERTEEPTNEELAAKADDSDPEAGDDDAGDADQEKELVSVGAASKTQSEGGRAEGAASGGSGRQKKTEATPKQHKGDNRPRRTGPITLIKESVAELRKVVYPTGPQLLNYFIVVLVFVLIIIGIVSLLDLGFGWVVFQIFGS